MKVDLLFCQDAENPFHGIAFEKRRSTIRNKDGSVVFDLEIVAPENWSQTAVDMLAQKYARKAGVPSATEKVHQDGVPAWLQRSEAADGATSGCETDARQIFNRLAGAWAYHGWIAGYFDSEQDAKNFYAEHLRMMAEQIAAANSPQWFSTGLWWAYGIEGDDIGQWKITPDGSAVERSTRCYVSPGVGACYILSLEDSLLEDGGILDFTTREARVFKAGSGSGANYSRVRGKNEPLSHGGKSSGLMSFLPMIDANAGAIKSGGTCLAPHTKVYTELGPVPVKDLAESGAEFVCLSYDPPACRYKAKRARAWLSGRKVVVKVTTDKGSFDVSYDHPMRLADGPYVEAGLLKSGQRLFTCKVDDRAGYLRVGLRSGSRRGRHHMSWHRLIAIDILGAGDSQVVDHLDGNKRNNRLSNLSITTQSAHAKRHVTELINDGDHVFQKRKFPKWGTTNPMHGGSEFWNDADKVAAYKKKQSEILLASGGRATRMAVVSSRQRMMNYAWRLINLGVDIGTFELYVDGRQKHIARLDSVSRLKRSIEKYFGSYANFLKEVNDNNHRVIDVKIVGEMNVYDVQVDCQTSDERVPGTGHNFVIWSGDDDTGTGVCVHNSRRAARMVVLDLDHPDIEEFIWWKAGEEKKVAALIVGSRAIKTVTKKAHHAGLTGDGMKLVEAKSEAASLGIPYETVKQATEAGKQKLACPEIDEFDSGYENAAYRTVTGQNANNSVSVTNEFMEKALRREDWNLYHRTELERAKGANRLPAPCKTLKADELWGQIAYAAWQCADPGVQFVTTMNDWNTVAEDGRIRATNPCSEFCFIDDSTCNLSCLNLVRLVNPNSWQDTTRRIKHASRIWTLALDITVGMSGYPSREIAEGARKYRTFGLGYANLGGLLMRSGIPYDSDEGRGIAACLTAIMHYATETASAEIAGELGAFPRCAENYEHVRRVMTNHAAYATDFKFTGLGVNPPDEARVWLDKAPTELRREAEESATIMLGYLREREFKLRNAQTTLIMPAGTVGLLMDCDTTGVEPDFSLVKGKTLAGGGWIKIVNQAVGPALKKLRYSDADAAEIMRHVEKTGAVVGCRKIRDEHLAVFDCAVGERSISATGHLKMMAAVQPVLSGASSKTSNIHKDATVADVRDVYEQAHKLMLKCVALYRDGSKLSQPLEAYSADDEEAKADNRLSPAQAAPEHKTKRKLLPNRRKGYTQKIRVGSHKVYIRTGEYPDGKLGEIFLTSHKEGALFRSVLDAYAQAISIALQHGVPLSEFVDACVGTRFEPNGVVQGHDRIKIATSVLDAVMRDLGIHYDGRDDLANVNLAAVDTPEIVNRLTAPVLAASVNGDHKTVTRSGVDVPYDGTPCTVCGALRVKPNGACKVCESCGTSTGC